MPRFRVVTAGLATALALAACGSARTELPVDVGSAPALETVPDEPAETTTTSAAAPESTASVYRSPGEKHPIPGGTLAASYPRVGVRLPRGLAPPPAGQAWAVHNLRFCAAPDSPISGDLVDPGRFRVEVPGQGYVPPTPGAPSLAPAPLVPGTGVAPGACLEGSLAYLVAGEGHIESITYDTGAGLLRWAT